MTVCIISIDHYLQYVEAETDSEALRTSKARLRAILLQRFSEGALSAIFEECSPAKPSIAQALAEASGIPWHNICMSTEERVAAGIFDALQNRPSSPDWDDMSCSIEYRIPEDTIREAYFVQRIETAATPDRITLVLLGDMHVQEVANALSAQGHQVEIVQELIAKKRWADPREV
ncbi:hypothetical protein [Tunturiibacter gelidiferens]|uniref:hypothetical protein n=1 Tax=Tunturiibacter gelidiferens TaxID=3069689 RepID=UPI003D9AFDEA